MALPASPADSGFRAVPQTFSLATALQWIISSWFPLTERLLIVVVAVISWLLFHPEIETCRDLAFGWIAQIYLRNLALLTLFAGGLHLYLYTWGKQDKNLKYDSRPLIKNNKKFTFNSQLLDNMFWSIASGATVWSGYEVLMMWSIANGYVPTLSMADDYLLILIIIFFIPIWETLYFFVIHRLIHWPPLYRKVHYLHHRNTNVGPWSGLSMHPVEHLLFLGSVLIHYVIPANPLIIIFHLQYFSLSAVTTHSGYQGLTLGDRLIIPLGTFHHQLHHRFFECNYGGLEIPMDKWTGTFHDGTNKSHREFLDRRRQKAYG